MWFSVYFSSVKIVQNSHPSKVWPRTETRLLFNMKHTQETNTAAGDVSLAVPAFGLGYLSLGLLVSLQTRGKYIFHVWGTESPDH